MTLIKFDIGPKKQRNPILTIITGIIGGAFCLVIAVTLLMKILFG